MADANQISQIVQGILDSYYRDGGINYASGLNLPSQQHIIDIIQTLRMILFPGYYTERAIEDESLPYTTGERVVWVYKHLREEITKSICFVCSECNASEYCQEIKEGDRIAQLIPRENITYRECKPYVRGSERSGGFGSTGK